MATKENTTGKYCDRWDTMPESINVTSRPGDKKKKKKPAEKGKTKSEKK